MVLREFARIRSIYHYGIKLSLAIVMQAYDSDSSTVKDLKNEAEQTVRRARPWIKLLARMGYAAKGAVYLLIGVTAILVAVGRRNGAEDFTGVLIQVFRQPFGEALLTVLAVGLIGYAVWCLIQAVMDTENKGSGVFGIITRLFYAGVGIVYASIAWSAFELLTGTGTVKQGDQPEQRWTARFLILPYGRWIVAIVGLGFVGFCVRELGRAFGDKFHILKTQRTNPTEDELATRIGQTGITARAIVFSIIGFFLMRAAINFDPKKVRGMAGALNTLAHQPHGAWLLAILALGLIFYGAYMLFLSWRRRIDPI